MKKIKLFHKKVRLISHCYTGWNYDPRCANKAIAILNHISGGVICLKPVCDEFSIIDNYVGLYTKNFVGLRYLGSSICFSVLRNPKKNRDEFKNSLFIDAFNAWDHFLSLNKIDKIIAQKHTKNIHNFMHYAPYFEQRDLSRFITRDEGTRFYFKNKGLSATVNILKNSDLLNLELNNIDKNLAHKLLSMVKSGL